MLRSIAPWLAQLARRTRNWLLVDTHQADLIRLGSRHGGWWLPGKLAQDGMIAVCAGAGEDITFDISLVGRGARVYTLDPTPRAVAHVAAVLKSLGSGSNGMVDGVSYHHHAGSTFDSDRFTFTPVGLWSKREELRFYAPRDPNHVSHSAVNLQGTTDYFVTECVSLHDYMTTQGIPRVDILKLDVEGAEYAVLEQMIADRIRPGCLLIEFDEGRYLDRFDRGRFMRVVAMLKRHYKLVRVEGWNFTFIQVS